MPKAALALGSLVGAGGMTIITGGIFLPTWSDTLSLFLVFAAMIFVAGLYAFRSN